MPLEVNIPVDAAPQDAHDISDAPARETVDDWRRAQDKQTVGADVVIGVVDTPVANHPWFYGQVLGDNIGGAPDVLTQSYKAGHATFIAGLVLQQAPAAKVIVDGVLGADGRAMIGEVAGAALRLVKRHNVDIVNFSFGCYGDDTHKQQFLQLLDDIWDINPRLVVVAAAGNRRESEPSWPFYPAALANHTRLVSAGAAVGPDGRQPAGFSNDGPDITFRVMGQGLVSTYLHVNLGVASGSPSRRWARWSGTSFAAAIVSGKIAATMAPNGGSRLTAEAAVAQLRGAGSRPVPLNIVPFP